MQWIENLFFWKTDGPETFCRQFGLKKKHSTFKNFGGKAQKHIHISHYGFLFTRLEHSN